MNSSFSQGIHTSFRANTLKISQIHFEILISKTSAINKTRYHELMSYSGTNVTNLLSWSLCWFANIIQHPQHLTCWDSPCHEEWASMASMLQGRGKGKMDGQKHEDCTIFFLYCPLSHSPSNAYHTGCHERVSSSIGHGCMSSFSEIIHIKPTVELAVELPVQLLVLCVWFVKMSSYHHVLYYCQWEWGHGITTSTSMPVKLLHSSKALYWRKNLMIQVL